MVKHWVEAVVKYGEFSAFREATGRYQKLAADHGLEPYTLWVNNNAGRMNEVFFEANFDSDEALNLRDNAENDIPEMMAALGDMLTCCVPGSVVDRRIQAV